MLQATFKRSIKLLSLLFLSLTTFCVQAQDKIEVNTGEVKSWLEANWMWVLGGIVLLIILIAVANSGKKKNIDQRKTTTVIKDPEGNVKSVTTTEDTV